MDPRERRVAYDSSRCPVDGRRMANFGREYGTPDVEIAWCPVCESAFLDIGRSSDIFHVSRVDGRFAPLTEAEAARAAGLGADVAAAYAHMDRGVADWEASLSVCQASPTWVAWSNPAGRRRFIR